jgi:hypothetical protein
MSGRFEHWLKARLERLVSVQRCTFGGPPALTLRPLDAALTIHMWTGINIHVYVLTEAIKTRQVREIVKSDTDSGVGTLLIVHPALLPAPGTVAAVPEWLLAVHALSADRIYTCCPGAEPCLEQMHLEPTPAAARFHAVPGPPVIFEHLHYQRTTVKPPYIKGFWLVAHFGAEPFWRGSDAPQPPRRAAYTPPRPRPAPSNGSSPPRAAPPPPPPPPRTPLERSYALLGIAPGATRAEVKAAFRRQALALHPDVSPLDKTEAEARFKALNAAYALIKAHNDWG